MIVASESFITSAELINVSHRAQSNQNQNLIITRRIKPTIKRKLKLIANEESPTNEKRQFHTQIVETIARKQRFKITMTGVQIVFNIAMQFYANVMQIIRKCYAE